MSEQLQLGDFEIEVVLKNIRNMHLRVYPPDGRVQLTASLRMAPGKIRGFALSKLDWIKRQQERIKKGGWVAPSQYQDGEIHPVWGKSYPLLVVEKAGPPLVSLTEDRLVLRIRKGVGVAKKAKLLALWYGELVKKALPPLVAQWEPILGVQVKRFFVRRMKTRWGTCHTRKGTIRLNADLAQKDPKYLEYVLVHEMAHLLEPSHNARFYGLMDRFMPQWKTYRGQLNLRTKGHPESI
jgi:predicted metal-dependent hydrolase